MDDERELARLRDEAAQARAEAAQARDEAQEARSSASTATSRARDAADDARDAAEDADDAREGARSAQAAAEHAAVVVAPDDPLLDTAVRRVEAGVDEEHPFGHLGPPATHRGPFRVAFTAAFGVLFAVLVAYSVVQARQVITLIATAAFIAIGLNPTVEGLMRRGLSRGKSIAVVGLGVLLFFSGVLLAVVPPVVEQTSGLIESAPDLIGDLQDNERIAALDERFGVLEQAQERLSNSSTYEQALGGVVGVGKIVLNAFFSTFTILVLTLYFLGSFTSIKQAVYRLVPRSRRARVGLLSDEILARTGGYVAGAVSIAVVAGVSSYVFLSVVGVPNALALAVLTLFLAFIPLVGATISAVVVSVVAFFVSVKVGIATVIFYALYQQFENYVLYPRVMKRSVDVSPAATVVAILVGGALLGVLGALLAIPVTAAIQLVLREVVEPRQDAA